jgi:hypothetical protein
MRGAAVLASPERIVSLACDPVDTHTTRDTALKRNLARCSWQRQILVVSDPRLVGAV